MYLDRGVDELRTANNPKAGGIGLYGYEGPAMSSVTQRGILGQMEKNRVDTSFEMGSDRWMTTTGAVTAPTCRSIDVLKNVLVKKLLLLIPVVLVRRQMQPMSMGSICLQNILI
jgi:hypothetical protein